ncbi:MULTISPECIES: hypothetical protein [unclassified Vibrio]|uniref:hypothetical protein n=1 Tax=unclassified Vibrio TaxID=2614977 RepID=UPI00352EA3D3|tara:strand:+ start:1003 stop:1185 length:183 start_codon:yes stop_codon:yes gene_type:complete
MSKKKSKPVRIIPGKEYAVTYGVNQIKLVSEAGCAVNETPKDFQVNAALERARKVTKPFK